MLNPYGLEVLMRERENDLRRSMILNNLKPPRKSRVSKTRLRRALPLSVAFAAGWLVASIL
jgi:hypothetical protein